MSEPVTVTEPVTEPVTPPTDADLARFQLAFTHVLGHPALGGALRHAVAGASASDDEVDLATSLAQHGIELPWGSTAVVLRAAKGAGSTYVEGGPAARGSVGGGYEGVRICALVGGSLYCVEFHPPVVLSSE